MRTRDVTIPLGLWLCAAMCAHFFVGTGGLVVAKVHDDRSELWKLAREAGNLAQQTGATFDVSLGEPNEPSRAEPPPPPPPPPTPRVVAERPKPPPTPPAATPPPPAPPRVVVVEKKADEKPVPAHLDPMKDRRIAVVQHAKPNQDDNPNAHYIADQANHVKEETRATQTSHDRNDENPTPAGSHASSDRNPGDSESTRIAEAEAHKGERNRGPGERGTDLDVQHEPRLPKPEPAPVHPVAAAPPNAVPSLRNPTSESRPAPAQAPPSTPQPPVGGTTPPSPASPDVESAANGGWAFNPARQAGSAGAAVSPNAGGSSPTLPGGRLWSLPGLGQSAAPGTMNTNLNQAQVAFIVGSDNLSKLREADGERRKSEHRGSWAGTNFDRWRSAIENYVSSVKPGNQTALNTAASPFGTYLNGMHNRIHPIFAETFLGWLETLPAEHPMNDHHLMTELEIVLTKEGRLKRMGVVKTSGITAFDIGALEAVDRAQPFGPPPDAIVSGDGNVYLHWEFHRDEVFACSTMGAAPFILDKRTLEHQAPPALPPSPAPGPANERGAPGGGPNDSRQGAAGAPRSGARPS